MIVRAGIEFVNFVTNVRTKYTDVEESLPWW